MDFRQLRYALAVARERSFTKAAKRVNISQSAVSEQVKLLEEEVGFELFRRTSGGVETTDRGRTFLYEAERVMGCCSRISGTSFPASGSTSGPRRPRTSSTICTKSASMPGSPSMRSRIGCRRAWSSIG